MVLTEEYFSSFFLTEYYYFLFFFKIELHHPSIHLRSNTYIVVCLLLLALFYVRSNQYGLVTDGRARLYQVAQGGWRDSGPF